MPPTPRSGSSPLARVRLKDVAARLGVSTQAVSLALRDSPGVSSRLAERIRATAEEMGYTPDPQLSALVAYRRARRPPKFTGTIAFVHSFPFTLAQRGEHVYYVRYFRAAREQAERLGFSLEECRLSDSRMTAARMNQILKSRGIRCLLIGPQPEVGADLQLDWDRFSAIALGYSVRSPRLNVVASNHFNSILICMRELLALGYRRIGLVIEARQDARVNYRWTGGYLAAQLHWVLPENRLQPFLAPKQMETDLTDWLHRQRPDAIIGGGPTLIENLHGHGISVPDDIGFALPFNLDNLSNKHIAQINEQPELIGRAAVELLAGMYMHSETGIPEKPKDHLIEGSWSPGTTVRKVDPYASGGRVL